MKLNELKSILRSQPSTYPRFTLPHGDEIPAHFHITEVGYVAKRFIDCGGVLHDRIDTCVFQTHVGDDVEHRLTSARFAKIVDLGAEVLPRADLDVEVEYDCCVTSQYPVDSASVAGEYVEIQLGEKHTACLAKQRCGTDGESCGCGQEGVAAASCC